jgi:hypothetical protein
LFALKQKTNDDGVRHEIKKKVMIMRNVEKIKKQKIFSSKVSIRFWSCLAGLAAVAGLIYVFHATIGTAVAIYLGYKIFRLTMRLIGQILSIVFTFVSIVVLIIIISLLIF